MSKKRTVDLVRETLTKFLDEEGYCLYNLEFVKEGKDWFLRVFIETKPEGNDKWPGNVTANDCEKVSRFLSDELDRLDPIKQNYYLEVSSPGLDRPLLKDDDFIRYKDHLVDIKLYKAVDGKKTMTGKLLDYTDENLCIENEKGMVLDLPKDIISKVNLTIVF